ncbi:MAG: SDR family NAD(P)-dependent oxidoreductase [Stackebrandtia sp.]
MDSLLDLDRQVIVITGGAGALGVPIARTLLDHGARVAIADIVAEAEVVERFPGDRERLLYVRDDLTDPDSAGRILDTVEAAWGSPDTVCCHAGMTRSAALPEHSLSDFDDVMRLNTRASYAMAREAATRWIDAGRGGNLVFTGSWVQDVPWPGIAAYAASKAALRSLARSFARELAPQGIRANVIAPGIVDAGMARQQWDTEPDYRARACRAVPLGRLQPPESVAHAVLFACSHMSSYMTGATLLIDGGASLYPMDCDD